MADLSKVKEVKELYDSIEVNKLLVTGNWILLFVEICVEDDVCINDEDKFAGLKRNTMPMFILGRVEQN